MFKSPPWAAQMDLQTANGVVKAISPARLSPYGLPAPPENGVQPFADCSYGEPGMAAVARHARNVTLCEAMYPVLHMLEVVMRNSLHGAFSEHFGAADWYEQDWLRPNHRQMVIDAKAGLTHRSRPHEVDRVVSQLSFGFWCGMFHAAYEQGPQAAWPALLGAVLPHVPKSWKTRAKVQRRVEDAREVRNRVFHHEPITFYGDLRERHRRLVEVLGWFSPDARRHVEQLSNFNHAYDDRLVLASA